MVLEELLVGAACVSRCMPLKREASRWMFEVVLVLEEVTVCHRWEDLLV